MERYPTNKVASAILIGQPSDDFVGQCTAILTQRRVDFIHCPDVYSAVACIARKCPGFLVLGRLNELSREDGRFFDLAARYGCHCCCLAHNDTASAQQQPQIVIASNMSELKAAIESLLDAPLATRLAGKTEFDKEKFKTTEAELKALLGT